MEKHRILGDKVTIFRRRDGGNWHCYTFLQGERWRKGTKERSLTRAKDIAEDLYMEAGREGLIDAVALLLMDLIHPTRPE